MKKALSIILALVLALTMALPAFAADHEIGLNEPQIIGNKNGDTETVVFTPEEDGIYKLSIEAKSGSLYDVCYYIDYDFIDDMEQIEYCLNNNFFFCYILINKVLFRYILFFL